MDTLEKLQYIRERINETEKESFKCLEEEKIKVVEDRLVELQNLYMEQRHMLGKPVQV